MTDQTTVEDYSAPPSENTDQPSEEPTETVESLKEQLAAEAAERQKAEEEAKRWKNRVKEENPPKEKSQKDNDEEYADWRIDNRDRIKLVQDEYEKELDELQESGAKVTISMREKALRLAESTVGVKKADKEEPLPSAPIDRIGNTDPKLSRFDQAMGIDPDVKKKYAHLESQW